MRRVAALVAVVVVMLGLAAAPAHAAEPVRSPMQERIDQVLAEFPGGVQIAPNAVSWERGTIVLELSGAVAARAFAGCATGAYCAWSGIGYTGSKLTFTACSATGSQVNLSPLGAPGSANSFANARSSGRVAVVNSGSTVRWVAAGTGVASFTPLSTHLRCFT